MKRTIKLLLIGAVALSPLAAFAAIDNTHHDMSNYITLSVQPKCAYCHSVSLATGAADALGQVGTFCAVVCHDGTVNGAQIDGVTYLDLLDTGTGAFSSSQPAGAGTLVLADSHGLDPAGLAWPTLDDPTDVAATGWPHASEVTMQCTSCHSVHDGARPPFLNATLASGDNLTAFCNRCHTGGAAAGTAGRYEGIGTLGAHPTEFTYSPTGDAGPTAAPGVKGGRTMVIKDNILHMEHKAGVTVAEFNATDDSVAGNMRNWQMGGHFQVAVADGQLPESNLATPALTFGCYSCHSAHQDLEGATTLALGATKEAVNGNTSVICVACHGPTLDRNNPGDTAWTHPTNEQSGGAYEHDHANHGAMHPNVPDSGTFPIDVAADLAAIDVGDNLGGAQVGTLGEVLCNTCHDVHGGVTGMMAIRQIGAIDATTGVCKGCHGTAAATAAATNYNWHHPSGLAAVDFEAAYPDTTGWNTAAGGAGDLTDGLGCGDCHVFGDTAHNW